jgi:hypothetical protein
LPEALSPEPYRILHPLTGPPWKNAAGVITPSFLNT